MSGRAFAGLELARRLETAEAEGGARFVESRARLGEIRAEWRRVAGAWALFDGAASPVTQTFCLGLFVQPGKDDLDELEDFFRSRGAPVLHEVSPLAGVDLMALLAARSYQPMELTSVLFQELREEGEAVEGERVQVRVIESEEADAWAGISAEGWSEHPELREFLAGMGRVIASRENSAALVAELAGVPAGTAAVAFANGVAVMAGASTIPAARRQGVQQALLRERLRLARLRGCDLAMMCAAPGSASQRNAERNGFRIAYTRIKWGLSGS